MPKNELRPRASVQVKRMFALSATLFIRSVIQYAARSLMHNDENNNNNNNKFIQYYHFVKVLPIKITINS